MKIRVRCLAGVFALAVLASCDPGPFIDPNFVTAQVNGVDYKATTAGWGVDSIGNTLVFSMISSDSVSNELLFSCPARVGTFGVALADGAATATYVSHKGTANEVVYYGQSGAVEITRLTDERAEGIFLIEAINIQYPDSLQVSITDGQFSLGVLE